MKHFFKAGIVALFLIAAFIVGLEYYWRSQGYEVSYTDDDPLWASERRKVYGPAERTTVFIGTSRMKYGLDIDTWEKMTGERAVQLAMVGTAPRKILFDLADDEKFAGKLVIDVMEPAFFPLDTTTSEIYAREALEYYYNETPTQRAGEVINHALESKLVLLDEGKFGLNNLLKDYSKNNRPGVMAPFIPFKKEYTMNTARRQSKFTPIFLNNPILIKAQIDHWQKTRLVNRKRLNVPKGASLDSFCLAYKTAIDKISARGGKVIFIRPPSTGTHLAGEVKQFSRNLYWDRLLQVTNTPGIHYADHPATANLPCVEDSHLSPSDATIYTASLVQTLKTDFGWKFPIDKKP